MTRAPTKRKGRLFNKSICSYNSFEAMNATSVHHATDSVVPVTRRLKCVQCPPQVVMRKAGIHPKYYNKAKVFCKGEHVLTLSGTQKEYHVDIWSGNHPLYQGVKNAAPVDDGPLSRFNAKYAGLEDLMAVPNLGTQQVQGLEAFKKRGKKKG